jgi:hypothetical protein
MMQVTTNDIVEIKVGVAVIQEQVKEINDKIGGIITDEDKCRTSFEERIEKLEKSGIIWDTKGKIIWGGVTALIGIAIAVATSLIMQGVFHIY